MPDNDDPQPVPPPPPPFPPPEQQINAIACALAVLRNEAGGYSPMERLKAERTLQAMYESLIKEITGKV